MIYLYIDLNNIGFEYSDEHLDIKKFAFHSEKTPKEIQLLGESGAVLYPLKRYQNIFLSMDDLKSFLEKNNIQLDLNFVASLIDFEPITKYDDLNFVRENIDKFYFDYLQNLIEYKEVKNSFKYKRTRNFSSEIVGDDKDRIADAFKMLEVILLLITGSLSDEEKEAIVAYTKKIKREDLVVAKNNDLINFVEKFFKREKQIRNLIDKDMEKQC